LRQSQTAVLERNTTFAGTFETEPFEAGWAAEARWFVQVLNRTGDGTTGTFRVQVSPDGLTWCDYDGVNHSTSGDLLSIPVLEFGHWLRLKGEVAGAEATMKLRIYLALKS
jgi:hypothetical protein